MTAAPLAINFSSPPISAAPGSTQFAPVNVMVGFAGTWLGGTVTLKGPQASELLLIFALDGVPIWSGEFYTDSVGSWIFAIPLNPAWGSTDTLTWQGAVGNYSNQTVDGIFEMQATILG